MFITVQFATVTGIKFNELYAQKRVNEIKNAFIDASAFLQFVLIPVCILVFVYSSDIVAILFGHGAFSKASVANTGQFMKYFILVLPFTAHNTLVARLFMAAQKIKKAFVFQVIMNSIMVVVLYLLISFLGPLGYPIGLLCTYVLISVASNVIMRRNFSHIPYNKSLVYSVRCLLINLPPLLLVVVLNKIIAQHTLWYMCGAFLIYVIALIGLNQVFKLNRTILDVVSNIVKPGMPEKGTSP
jgi:peptidoglycan biosynthesis protein MviN/MurJ (putative lipid II flippase)